MDKTELFRRISEARARIDAAIDRVPDARKGEIALYGLWSMKDFIAHLTVWERYALDVAGALSNGREPRYQFGAVPVDQINAETYEANKGRSLADIRAEAVATHAELLAMIEAAPDAMLFDGNYWPYTQGHSFKAWISTNSYKHYDEHLPDVLDYLQRAGL
jgi:hypothetical protein